MVGRWLRVAVWWATAATAAWGGCAEPGPTYFPVAPLAEERLADGRVSRLYDLSGDGSADYSEVLSAEGRVALLRYDVNGDGTFEEEVARRTAGAAARDNQHQVPIVCAAEPGDQPVSGHDGSFAGGVFRDIPIAGGGIDVLRRPRASGWVS